MSMYPSFQQQSGSQSHPRCFGHCHCHLAAMQSFGLGRQSQRCTADQTRSAGQSDRHLRFHRHQVERCQHAGVERRRAGAPVLRAGRRRHLRTLCAGCALQHQHHESCDGRGPATVRLPVFVGDVQLQENRHHPVVRAGAGAARRRWTDPERERPESELRADLHADAGRHRQRWARAVTCSGHGTADAAAQRRQPRDAAVQRSDGPSTFGGHGAFRTRPLHPADHPQPAERRNRLVGPSRGRLLFPTFRESSIWSTRGSWSLARWERRRANRIPASRPWSAPTAFAATTCWSMRSRFRCRTCRSCPTRWRPLPACWYRPISGHRPKRGSASTRQRSGRT